jgi:hypothetical protein
MNVINLLHGEFELSADENVMRHPIRSGLAVFVDDCAKENVVLLQREDSTWPGVDNKRFDANRLRKEEENRTYHKK